MAGTRCMPTAIPMPAATSTWRSTWRTRRTSRSRSSSSPERRRPLSDRGGPPPLGSARGGGAVERGPLPHRAADALTHLDELLDRLGRAVLRAGHPGDGLLHQRAAEVVGARVEHRLGALDAELDPRGLDVVDAAVQHDPGHRVDRTVVARSEEPTSELQSLMRTSY